MLLSIVSLFLAIGGFSVASLYSSRKQALLHHIDGMLKHLRNMETWDDRSESKLFQWMLESDESTLHYRSLLELRNILNSLTSYWAVHVSMDSDEDLTPEELVSDFNKEPETWSLRFIFKEFFSPDKPRLLI
ncbi:MAG: hypothetical protein KKF30_13985 [Proteobacteria bacterium]|nr:hypothetical protein [Pseudomonadota bacterium]